MPETLQGKRIAFLVANEGVEQVELTEPLEARARGRRPKSSCSRPKTGEVQAFNHLDKGDTFTVDRAVGDADAGDYDGLVLPGRRRQPRPAAHRRGRGRVRPRLLRGRQAGRRDLPRARGR